MASAEVALSDRQKKRRALFDAERRLWDAVIEQHGDRNAIHFRYTPDLDNEATAAARAAFKAAEEALRSDTPE